MHEGWLWLAVLIALPAASVAASFTPIAVEALRRLFVVAAAVMVGAALLFVAGDPTAGFVATASRDAVPLIRVNTLSAALLPFAAVLWLLTVAVTPRSALDRAGLRRTAVATLITLVSFLTEHAALLLLLWAGSVWTFLRALSGSTERRQRRIVAVYLGASTVIFACGVALITWVGDGPFERAGLWLIVLAALIRKGIFPFHAWVPETCDHGRLGPAVLFSAPQIGAYVTTVLVVPSVAPDVLRFVAVLALGTAVYGAGLALVQTSARRACGYLFVSQSALVMAGLDCTSQSALTGGLIIWLSSGIAFAGLARAVLVLEARRGRLDLSRYHGGYSRMPTLAVTFLVMGLAFTGFPGTIAFAGQELLVSGAVDVFPVLGFAVVLASALTGLAVLRMYFALFCGRAEIPTEPSKHLGLRRSEVATFTALVVLLIGLGLLPRLLVDSRAAASDEILRRREQGQVAPQSSRSLEHDAAGPVRVLRGSGGSYAFDDY